MNKSEGYESGDTCNRDGCNGIIKEHEKEGCCSCHINPPCGYCTEPTAYCDECGWDDKEERDEHDKAVSKTYEANAAYYKEEREKAAKATELFYKKYRGEIEAEELEMRTESHTHFSMRVIGVFPKGSETRETLRPKVNGTFGGRFTSILDENSYKFEFIAYTD